VGFKEDKVLLMALGDMEQIAPGSEVFPTGESQMVPVSHALKGRVLDALGQPLDGKGLVRAEQYYPAHQAPPDALDRKRISEPLQTGVRVIDSTCTVGVGQRMGIFAGSGVGKSTLIGMIAKMTSADVNVIALVGERGREVREFIEGELGPAGLARSVIIVATSDQPALLRARAAMVATSIAEYFRDHGQNVLFMMDSVTRYAMAMREIGLAVGEPPTTKGYTPSVFARLPQLLERTGYGSRGAITGSYTFLVEGDDMNDPVADTVRSILDGHLVLSRKIASANQYPAIDVLESLSRLMKQVASDEHKQKAGRLREILQTYKEAEDLLNIGAYQAGSNPKIDEAVQLIDAVRSFLKQDTEELSSFDETVAKLIEVIPG
jgi:FliI/YscN family ATPase